jgi:hypothetical protein
MAGRQTLRLRHYPAIPSDNYIRLMLDGASPAVFDALVVQAIMQPAR